MGRKERGEEMNKINMILFYICAGCCAWEWSLNNQAIAIWMGFVALGNLFYAFFGEDDY